MHKSSKTPIVIMIMIVTIAVILLILWNSSPEEGQPKRVEATLPHKVPLPATSEDQKKPTAIAPTEEELRAYGIVSDSLGLLAKKSSGAAVFHQKFQLHAGIGRLADNEQIMLVTVPASKEFAMFIFLNILSSDFLGNTLVATTSCGNGFPLIEIRYVTKKPSAALGLVIAHEMVHVMQCLKTGGVSHLPGSDEFIISELEAYHTENLILDEFTEGKWLDFIGQQMIFKGDKFGKQIESIAWQYEIENDVKVTLSNWLGELDKFELGSILPLYLIALNMESLTKIAQEANAPLEIIQKKQLEFMRELEHNMNTNRNPL